ncbi:MAG: DUF4398 domain-containing protein [Bdellovibrionota bacterium]
MVRVVTTLIISFIGICGFLSASCSLFTVRPVQEMSETAAAIRAARELNAFELAPELFRQSQEWFHKARHEYKMKNFNLAKDYAGKSRALAEQAEFEAMRAGATRSGYSQEKPQNESKIESSEPQPTPTGTPVEVYEQRKAEEQNLNKTTQEPTPSPTP